jgi:hypothetical protein
MAFLVSLLHPISPTAPYFRGVTSRGGSGSSIWRPAMVLKTGVIYHAAIKPKTNKQWQWDDSMFYNYIIYL